MEESENLPYLQANKSACCCLVDDGKRQEKPWSETKDSLSIAAITEASVSAFLCQLPNPQFSQGNTKRVK